jgi:hypothetical protein
MKQIHELRAHYMSHFERVLAESRPQFSHVAAEVMLEVPLQGESELLYRVYRADIMAKTAKGPTILEANVEPMVPQTTNLDGFGIPVVLLPAVWNGIEFVVDGPLPSEAKLLPWIAKWIDIDDQRYVEGQAFQSVIHNCLRPTVRGSRYRTSVDFGSAPVEAVLELIEILKPGARSIEIGSGLDAL